MTVKRIPDLREALERVTYFRSLIEEFVEKPEEVRQSRKPILKKIGRQAKKNGWKLTQGAYAAATCLEDILRLAVEDLGKRKWSKKRKDREEIEELLAAQAETLRALYRLEKAVTPLAKSPMGSSALCNRAIGYIQKQRPNDSMAETELTLIYMLQSFLELMEDRCQEARCRSCKEPCIEEERRRKREE